MTQDDNAVSGHWELNLALASPPTSTEVPEPGMAVLVGMGLLGLGIARRRSRKA